MCTQLARSERPAVISYLGAIWHDYQGDQNDE